MINIQKKEEGSRTGIISCFFPEILKKQAGFSLQKVGFGIIIPCEDTTENELFP